MQLYEFVVLTQLPEFLRDILFIFHKGYLPAICRGLRKGSIAVQKSLITCRLQHLHHFDQGLIGQIGKSAMLRYEN